MTKKFTLFTNEVIRASDFTFDPGEEVHALVSADVDNDSGTIYNSLKIKIKYTGLDPAGGGQFFIGALVESLNDDGSWSPIAYQFSPLRAAVQAPERIIILQPDLDTFNLGIDDIVFPVDTEVARISREQGAVPDSKVRVCISFKDNESNGVNAFNEVTVNATGELYNA